MNIFVAYYEALLPYSPAFVIRLAMSMAGIVSSFRRGVNGMAKTIWGSSPDESRKGHPRPRMRPPQESMPSSTAQAQETKDLHHQPPVKTDAETKIENRTSPSTNIRPSVQRRTQTAEMSVKESVRTEPKAAERSLYSDAVKKTATDKKLEEKNARITREQKPAESENFPKMNRASAENSQLSSRAVEAEKKYALAEKELVKANEKNETERKKVVELQQEITRLQQESAERMKSLETQLQSVIKQSDIRKLEVERVNKELEKVRELRKEEHALLDLRMRELQDARAYLTTEDAMSGEEIKGMTEALNTEIYQVAAFMADTLDFDWTLLGDEQTQAAAARCVGEHLVRALSGGAPRDDSEEETRHLATLAAIQASLVQSCSTVINAWALSQEVSGHFAHLYMNIRRTCTPAVAGRWRAMTRAGCKYLGSDMEVEEQLTGVLLRNLIPVLVVAGWKLSSVVQIENAIGILGQEFGTRMIQVAKKLVRLDRAMGEGVISKDAALGWVPGGAPFDLNVMENAFGKSTGISAEDFVLSTCDLGLVLSQVIRNQEGAGSSIEVESQILLKPKVVLYSALFEHK
ncbi:hypothetical protein DFS33DRAFT_1491806 [Desarmillaria ectypa]|nr:hypothetical protein DFS33DRAFT_1491806 [Desarmillaria ectypa]